MIDLTNTKYIPLGNRREILMRALYTQPFYYRMDFPILPEAEKTSQFAQNIGIGRDFYLTETLGNFAEVFTDTTSLFDITLYTGNNRSLWRYEATRKLPTGFMLQDARFRTAIAAQIFDDRQFEYPPKLIRNNDKVYAEIRNVNTKADTGNAIVVLKGFALVDNAYLSESETAQINKSLNSEVQWQWFKIKVEDLNGKKTFILENDKIPRLILGFGAVNSVSEKSNVSFAELQIKDLSRRLQFTDRPIPLEFIAPRLTCEQDTHIYYLPTEYYWQPLARLEFDINNIPPGETDAGFELAVLTRNI